MISDRIPEPTVMPVDHDWWAAQLNLCNFVNAFYQYRDLQGLPDCESVLIIGPGQGLDAVVLKWRGYRVTTYDIDDRFRPDFVGSVHELSAFSNGQFDAVIASHVLEHLPEPYLEKCLTELSRVARYALVYLPVAGRHAQLRLVPAVRNLDLSVIVDLFPFWRRPDGSAALYCEGQHFWEIGHRGFRRKDIRKRFGAHFEILKEYRNRDWTPSYNYVLRSGAR